MKPKHNVMSSAEKVLKILLAFTPDNHEMGTLTLSQKLEIHKSTVSRLLHILTDYNLLQQNPVTKKYFLGRAAAKLGESVMKSISNNVVSIAIPYMTKLAYDIGESIALEVLSGTEIYLAHHVEGQKHIRFSFNLGERVPTHVAAGAKAILAFCSPEFVNSCLQSNLHRYTAKTIVSRKDFFSLLKKVREKGVAFDHGERYEDSHAIGVPIFNHEGAPVAAVVMAGPAFRLTSNYLENAIAPLKTTAASISNKLYY